MKKWFPKVYLVIYSKPNVVLRLVQLVRFRIFQDENRSLVERLIKYKAKDADKMNEENEHFLK